MSNYVQVVTESTQISGALLDHAFIRKDLLKNEVRSVVRTLHFSDHDAVVLTLMLKSNASNAECHSGIIKISNFSSQNAIYINIK